MPLLTDQTSGFAGRALQGASIYGKPQIPTPEYNPLRSRYCEEAQGVTARPHGPDA